MRQWVEKLAKVTKEEGCISDYGCEVKNIRWSACSWNYEKSLTINLIEEDKRAAIKIYEDEYDLLKSVNDYLRKVNQDYIINQLNNL